MRLKKPKANSDKIVTLTKYTLNKMIKRLLFTFTVLGFLYSCSTTSEREESIKNQSIIKYDRPESSILKGVYIPAGKELFFTSGL